MKRRCSDRRLARLVSQALYALEDPAAGFVFDDFDRRYCEAERKREADAARWFYRDKTSFEMKYEADCAKDGEEPAWVSDCGRGSHELESVVSAAVDGVENLPRWLVLWRQKRLELTPKRRAVLDALAVDWRTRPAAKIAGVSQPTVELAKKNLSRVAPTKSGLSPIFAVGRGLWTRRNHISTKISFGCDCGAPRTSRPTDFGFQTKSP